MSRWFRMYDAVLDDPKVQKLEPRLFKAWVNLLCVASRNDGSIPPADAAFALRLSDKETAKVMVTLVASGLLDNDGVLRPHNWNGRQYKSDGSSERVKRFRERQSNGVCNVTETADATGPEAETEAETELEKPEAKASAKKRADDGSKRGTRLPADWGPSDADCDFALQQGLDPGGVAAKFRDFWIAKPGRDGLKLDWAATWRNWCRNDAGGAQGGIGRSGGDRARPGGLLAAAHAVLSAAEQYGGMEADSAAESGGRDARAVVAGRS